MTLVYLQIEDLLEQISEIEEAMTFLQEEDLNSDFYNLNEMFTEAFDHLVNARRSLQLAQDDSELEDDSFWYQNV